MKSKIPQNHPSKVWYKSKTMIFNISVALLTSLPIIQPMLTPVYYAWVLFGVTFVNIVLRAKTNQGVTRTNVDAMGKG